MQPTDRLLVTGGAAGIGAGIAAAFPAQSVVWSRRTGVDVTDEAAVKTATEALLAAVVPWGLVHCVGDFDEVPLLDADAAHFAAMLDSNLRSAWLVAKYVVPAMVAAGRGRVVFFTAAGADVDGAKTRAPIYFAAKAAVASLAQSLAAEVAGSGVTVNVVAPGIIRHPHSHASSQARMAAKVPLGRPGVVDDVVGAVEFLLSSRARYITGTTITVDGGLSL